MLDTKENLVFSPPRMFFSSAILAQLTVSFFQCRSGRALGNQRHRRMYVLWGKVRTLSQHHFTAFAEELPILHIVGQQKTEQQDQGLNIIHTLGNGRYVVTHLYTE